MTCRGVSVAILDACHSGTVAEKERPMAQPDGLIRDLTAEDSGVIVMCASAGREYATGNQTDQGRLLHLRPGGRPGRPRRRGRRRHHLHPRAGYVRDGLACSN